MNSQTSNPTPITVVWIDDQVHDLQDLVQLMKSEGDFQVNGLFTDAKKSLDYVYNKHPDIALVDVDIPEISGLELTPKLKALSPQTQAIVVSVHAEKFIVQKALRKGASGFMAKSDAGEELLHLVRAVNRGERPVFSKTIEEALKR